MTIESLEHYLQYLGLDHAHFTEDPETRELIIHTGVKNVLHQYIDDRGLHRAYETLEPVTDPDDTDYGFND